MIDDREQAISEVRGWLDLAMNTGSYSRQLLEQLVVGYLTRSIHVHCVYDSLRELEYGGVRKTGAKLPSPFKHLPLRGLWHKHYVQPVNLMKNVFNHWQRKSNGLNSTIADFGQVEKLDHLSHHLVISGYSTRSERSELTGEWIVFAKADQRNYYLTLGEHGDDRAVFGRVMKARSDFPFLPFYAETDSRDV